MHVPRNADAWLVGLTLAFALAFAGHALGEAAAEAAGADAPHDAWPGFDRLKAAAPFAGGATQPPPGEPEA